MLHSEDVGGGRYRVLTLGIYLHHKTHTTHWLLVSNTHTAYDYAFTMSDPLWSCKYFLFDAEVA